LQTLLTEEKGDLREEAVGRIIAVEVRDLDAHPSKQIQEPH
jgi:hypothetical protein